MWKVPGKVVRVIDGDTVVVDLDLGWRVFKNLEHVRIDGINAPEIRTEEGKRAADHARTLLKPGDHVLVESTAKPSFERTVGKIWFWWPGDPRERDFGEVMVAAGHAVWVKYP
jgi:endonuclease YncB( thermonuclease family)